jgi:hypothetical protein
MCAVVLLALWLRELWQRARDRSHARLPAGR